MNTLIFQSMVPHFVYADLKLKDACSLKEKS